MSSALLSNQISLDIPTAKVLRPLLAPSRYKGIHGGRGSMKSHFFGELAVEMAVLNPGFRLVCVREVQKSLKESAKRLIEDKIERFGLESLFKSTTEGIQAPGGGVFLFQGMQDHTAESIKSLEGFDAAWVEEAQTMSQRSLEFLRPTIRADGSELWFSWNPRNANDPVDQLLRGLNPPQNAIVIETSYKDNPWFPAVLEEERQYDELHNRDRYGHIWLGHYEPAAIGAIWDRVDFHNHRRDEMPELERIVISIDPAVSNTPDSDEHGITVVGRGVDKRGYLLEDGTLRGTPEQWAGRAVALFDKWEADAVVAEVNQGGDMVEHTLKTVRPELPVIQVRATRGKHVRAEPISALYKTGKVSHVGTFTAIEDQMCLFTASGYEGQGSPDRAEAAIWGLTELFPGMVKKPKSTADITIPALKRL